MDVNSKFVGLPEGYTYKLVNRIHNPKSRYQRYKVMLITPEGKEIPLIGADDQPIGFASNQDIIYSLGEVRDTLIRNKIGDGIEYYYHLHGYGERTGKYLDACKSNIGLIDTSCDEELSITDIWTKLSDGAINSSDIYVTQDERGFVAAFQVGVADAVYEHRYIFNRRPTSKAVWDAYVISEIELGFALNKYGESYDCWECGNKVMHWLDVEGNLRKKWDKLKDKYCGC